MERGRILLSIWGKELFAIELEVFNRFLTALACNPIDKCQRTSIICVFASLRIDRHYRVEVFECIIALNEDHKPFFTLKCTLILDECPTIS